ncbi:MAG: carboxymuconolactone decarboxylase family protein, partial [Acidimicrobiia bacterium]
MTDTPEPGPTPGPDPERLARGLAKYREVYGDEAVVFDPGQVEFFDLMIAQLFGEVWTRPALGVEQRRLLVMGVVAAQHRFDTLEIQLTRALDAGELTVQQVRDVVIQLIPYVGYPSSSDLFRVGETAIG